MTIALAGVIILIARVDMQGWFQSIAKTLKGAGSRWSDEGKVKPFSLRDHPTTVLAIDDDNEFLATIQELLSAHGFHVFTASSGPKGLNILSNGPKDLRVVLLDYKMPDFTGLDTLHHIHRVRPDVRIIAITGIPPSQLPEEFHSGVDRLISKPLKITDLVAAIMEQARLHVTTQLPLAPRPTALPHVPKSHPDIQL